MVLITHLIGVSLPLNASDVIGVSLPLNVNDVIGVSLPLKCDIKK